MSFLQKVLFFESNFYHIKSGLLSEVHFIRSTTTTTEASLTCGKGKESCRFPFKVGNKTYNQCTYDYSVMTGYKPWCSIEIDENGQHVSGKWAICNHESCKIPPRRKLLKKRVRFNSNVVFLK